MGQMTNFREDKVLEYLIHLFKEIKLKSDLNGYDYLVEAIIRRYYNEHYKNNIYSDLYDDIAKQFNATIAGVEKEIRYALEVTWTNEHSIAQYDFYGCITSKEKGKPTSAKFIERTVEILKQTFN